MSIFLGGERLTAGSWKGTGVHQSLNPREAAGITQPSEHHRETRLHLLQLERHQDLRNICVFSQEGAKTDWGFLTELETKCHQQSPSVGRWLHKQVGVTSGPLVFPANPNVASKD